MATMSDFGRNLLAPLLLVTLLVGCVQSDFAGRPLRPPADEQSDWGVEFETVADSVGQVRDATDDEDAEEDGGFLDNLGDLIEQNAETAVQDNLVAFGESLVTGDGETETAELVPVVLPGGELQQQQQQQPEQQQQQPEQQSRGATGSESLVGHRENQQSLTRLFHGLYYQAQYSKINSYLVEKVPSADFGANMRAAEEWLARERSRGVNLFTNRATVEALEQFVSLGLIRGRCDRVAYAIIWKNDRATRGEAHRRPSKMPRAVTRVTALVHKAALEHAVDCLNVYPDAYLSVRASLQPQIAENVERFLTAVVEQHVLAKKKVKFFDSRLVGTNFDPIKLVYDIKSISGRKIAEIAYEAIDSFSALARDPNRRFLRQVVDERRGELVVDNQQVRLLVKRYLVEPCAYYVRALGPDVFIPAAYDSRMLEKQDRYKHDGDRVGQLIHGWLRYRLCELLVNKDEPALADGVVAVARARKSK